MQAMNMINDDVVAAAEAVGHEAGYRIGKEIGKAISNAWHTVVTMDNALEVALGMAGAAIAGVAISGALVAAGLIASSEFVTVAATTMVVEFAIPYTLYSLDGVIRETKWAINSIKDFVVSLWKKEKEES